MYVLVWHLRRGVLLAVVGLILAVSLLAVGRGPDGPLRLAVPEPLLTQATRLAREYLKAHPDRQVELLPVPGEEAAAGLVRSGEAGAALVPGALAPAGGTNRPERPRWAARLELTTVAWEAVVAASGPFLPPGSLTSGQVRALLRGESPEWGTVVPGLAGRINLYKLAGSGVEPLLSEFLGTPGKPLRPGRAAANPASLGQALLQDQAGLALIPAGDLPAGLRVWPVDGVSPTPKDWAAGRYPLARPVFLASPAGLPHSPAHDFARVARLVLGGGSGRRSLTLLLAGDFLPDGPVAEAAKARGPEWPWSGVAPLTAACDLALLNLEAPLSELGWKIGAYRGDPAAVRGLRSAGIDAVALANDHILDYDDPALLSTLALLDREGIAHSGAGATLDLARKPAILERGGTKVAFLAYGRPEQGRTTTGRRWEASPWSPGIAPADPREVVEDVGRAAGEAEVVVVSIHWGEEGAELPRPEDRLLARAAIDAGARVVVGFGSGLPQGMEAYGGGLILYDLGGFLRAAPDDSRRLGLAVRLTLAAGRLADVELVPVWNEGGRADILQGQRRRDALLLLSGRTKRLAEVGESDPAPNPDARGGPPNEQQHDHRDGSPNPRSTRRLLPPALPALPG